MATLTAGSLAYSGTLAIGPQTMPVSMSQTTKAEGETWVVDGLTKVAGQEINDSTAYAKDSLQPIKRSVKQGPVAIEITFADRKAMGSMAMGGPPKPFTVELGGDIFADGSGASDSLACLPLAEGYGATFRNFDVQKQKVTIRQAKVVGSEEAKVAAGTFQTWKVELSSAEGEPGLTTLWVAKDSRKVVKTTATLPQMGGAVITLELQ